MVWVRPNLQWTSMLFIWIDRLLEWVNQHQLVFFIRMNGKYSLLSDIWGKQRNLMLQMSWTNESQFTTVLNDDIHKWTLCRLLLLLIAAPRVSRLSVIYSVSFAGDLHFSQHCHCLIYSVGAPVVKSAPPSDSLGGGWEWEWEWGGLPPATWQHKLAGRDHAFDATESHKLFTVR